MHANHLIRDDARGMSAHNKEMVSPEIVEYNPPLDIQREPVIPITRLQVQSEVDNEVSRKSSVISSPVVNNFRNCIGKRKCGLLVGYAWSRDVR